MRKLAVVIDFYFCIYFVVKFKSFQAEDQVWRKLFYCLQFLCFYFFVAFLAVVFIASVEEFTLHQRLKRFVDVLLHLQTHWEKLFFSFWSMVAFLRNDLMHIDSSKQLLDKILLSFFSDSFLYFLEQNRGKLVNIHLLVKSYHRSFLMIFESSCKISRIDIIFLGHLQFQE